MIMCWIESLTQEASIIAKLEIPMLPLKWSDILRPSPELLWFLAFAYDLAKYIHHHSSLCKYVY